MDSTSVGPTFVWLRSVAAVVAIYLGCAALSLFMLLDNFDRGAKASHEIAYLILGTAFVAGLCAWSLRHERPLPPAGAAVAVVVALLAVVSAHLLLRRYREDTVPGEPASASARRLFDLAPLVVAAAPLLVFAVSGRHGRRRLLIVASAIAAVGWLGVAADFATTRLP